MKIGVVGLGYVGLTLSIAAAEGGIDVYGVEVNPHIIKCIKDNCAHFFEPGLNELLRLHNNNKFSCVDTFPCDERFDAFIITVGTPLKKDSKEPDFDYIRTAIQAIKSAYDGSQVIILRSTVSVGTTRKVVVPYLEELLKDKYGKCDTILVSMCPERTVEGKAVEELRNLPQIISGNNADALALARKLFLHITPKVIEANSLEEAELAKLYCNTYRDMEFAIGNAFCLAAQEFGVDGIEVIKRANEGYSRARIAIPGFVAGPCLEKDAYILTDNMEKCLSKEFILAGRSVNEYLEDAVVKWVELHVGKPGSDNVVALSGMAFKGSPETSDLRGSASVNIAKKLHVKGYMLRMHDFVAHKNEIEALRLGPVFETLEEACNGTVALLVLNNHSSYAEIREIPVGDMKSRYSLLDVWQSCINVVESANIKKYNLGNFLMGR